MFVENRDFCIPLPSTAPLGRSPSEYCHNLRPSYGKKTRMMYAPDGEKLDDMFNCLAVSTQYRCVTDRRTDRQTDIFSRHSPQLCRASCTRDRGCVVVSHLLLSPHLFSVYMTWPDPDHSETDLRHSCSICNCYSAHL